MTRRKATEFIIVYYLASKQKSGKPLTEKEFLTVGAMLKLFNSDLAIEFWQVMEYVDDCLMATIESVKNYNSQPAEVKVTSQPNPTELKRHKLKQKLKKVKYRGMSLADLVDLSEHEIFTLYLDDVISLSEMESIKAQKARFEALLKMPNSEIEEEEHSNGLLFKIVKFLKGY
jgi:hypothetical protein